jgi:hypothetical protein
MQPLQELGSLLADHLPADVNINLVCLHPLRQGFIHILIHDRSPGFGVPIYSFLPCQQLRWTLQSVADYRLRHRHLVNLLQPFHQGPLTKGWVVPLILTKGNVQGLHQMAAGWFRGLRHCWLLVKKKTGLALLLCTSSVTKSIYKSLYSLGNWATVHIWGYNSKQKLVVRRFSRMFPDVPSLPIHVD